MTKLLAGRQVLIVEDEMLVLMGTEGILLDLGCTTVAAAGSVEAALAIIAEERIDAVLLDLNLGGDISYPVADALRARDIPFAFTTGYGDAVLRPEDLSRPLLTKPYSVAELVETLRALLPPEVPMAA